MKINKHPHGSYYTTFKKKFIYGTSPEEVEAKYHEMAYMNNQGYNVGENPTMKEFMKQWYSVYKSGHGALKTQTMYQNCVNHHINPYLGDKKVKEITATQIQNRLNSIKSSKSLAHKVRITLNQIFNQAITDRLVTFNPVKGCKVIAPDEPKREFLTPEQRDLMLEILYEHRAYPLIFTLLYSGMRMGEALALLWKDIDLEKEHIIKVTKATEYDHAKPKNKAPKTKNGIREIPIPLELLNYLKQYKAKQPKGLYVFPGHEGGPMGLTEIDRIWKKAQKKIKKWFKENENKPADEKIKIDKFTLTFRLLRHTYCTGLYDAGIDEVSAAEIMGHDVSIMREIYTHISKSRKEKTKVKLENLYRDEKIIELKESK
jgi:integrase